MGNIKYTYEKKWFQSRDEREWNIFLMQCESLSRISIKTTLNFRSSHSSTVSEQLEEGENFKNFPTFGIPYPLPLHRWGLKQYDEENFLFPHSRALIFRFSVFLLLFLIIGIGIDIDGDPPSFYISHTRSKIIHFNRVVWCFRKGNFTH